ARIRRARIHDGKGAGVWVKSGGKVTLEDCEILENALSGVIVTQQSDASLVKCKVCGNLYSGVEVGRQSRARVRGGCIQRNESVGVRLWESSTADVEDCDLADNIISAWSIDRFCSVTERNNKE